MAYIAPYVDESGLHLPTYDAIRDDIIAKVRDIYGQDMYLESDSQDYQFISVFSLMLYDAMQSVLLAYNNANPITAVHTGLDRLVALSGIQRRKAKASTCVVKVTGSPGTVLESVVVQDVNGYNWKLPAYVAIGGTGEATATATCVVLGAIHVPIGGIDTIVTPIQGWQSVTNEGLATVGADVETDGELRARQAISASIVARAVLDGIVSAVFDVEGVTKVRAYENDTSSPVGVLPAHSITIVVLGGDDEEVAHEIYYRKTLGAATFGDTSVTIEDEYGQSGVIQFQRASDVTANVTVNITALPAYSEDEILPRIKDAVAKYIEGIQVGDDLYITNLFAPIMQSVADYTTAPFYITGITVNTQSDVVTQGLFDYFVCSADDDVTVNVTGA